ncbi:Uncharacterised protein [Mycobacteroides abscessus subsp. abscessus]|nr:Uncharacterised protein [Mycobacteroides abscessus subsp. abscessus]
MAPPQPFRLAGPDQTALHADCGERRYILDRPRKPLTEYLGSGLRHREGLAVFHVKHSSRSAATELHG